MVLNEFNELSGGQSSESGHTHILTYCYVSGDVKHFT